AANNGDSTDDGEMLANNYRCRQIIKATKEIYYKYKNNPGVSLNNRTRIEQLITQSERLWLQATCTDSTGIGPDATERVAAETNIFYAEKKCASVLKILAKQVSELNVSRIQVDLKTGAIYNNKTDFISLINVSNICCLYDLPFDISFNAKVDGEYCKPNVKVSLVSYNSSDSISKNEVFNLYRLDVIFRGSHDWVNDSISSIGIKFKFRDRSNFREIIYSPSLLENETKRLWRYNYKSHPVYVYLPLSNGLLFIPDDYTGFKGTAIIKNVTQRHTSWLWEYWYIKILETEGLHMDAHHQIYIMKDVTLDTALAFANRINVFPPWIVSQNVNLTQGHEVYQMYDQIENRLSDEDEGSGEWW
ncbi:MAG: hypothetical protein ACTSQG_05945, partial [Promethearchaeota archaeon]